MKSKLYLLFLLATLLAFISVQANSITVKGNVKLTNGSPAKSVEVKIAVYLAGSSTSCSEQTVSTDNNGLYSKEMTCQGDIKSSRVSLKNCDGATLAVEKEVPASKIVEANFVICQASAPACSAQFTAEAAAVSSSVPALSIKFNSSISTAGSGDNIVHRTWNFNDGSPMLTDRVDPVHTFPHSGPYDVCLTIKTGSGCESKICKQVTVLPTSLTNCSAKFTFEQLGPKKFRFNSGGSATAANDNIVERKWDFRDGTTSTDVAPLHEFAKAGNYEVCLTIKTTHGCESKLCVAVKAEEVAGNDNSAIKIVSLYPTPVHQNLNAVIFSRHTNVLATISIVNTSATVEFARQVTLVEGNNPLTINVNSLIPGTYFLKVATPYGTVTKPFYKI